MALNQIQISYITETEKRKVAQDLLPIDPLMIPTYIEGLKRYFPKIHITETETQTYISFLEVEGTNIIDLTIKK